MPIPLIQPLIEEKNKTSQEQPWLVFLKLVNVAGDVTINLVRNTENDYRSFGLHRSHHTERCTLSAKRICLLYSVSCILLSSIDHPASRYYIRDTKYERRVDFSKQTQFAKRPNERNFCYNNEL